MDSLIVFNALHRHAYNYAIETCGMGSDESERYADWFAPRVRDCAGVRRPREGRLLGQAHRTGKECGVMRIHQTAAELSVISDGSNSRPSIHCALCFSVAEFEDEVSGTVFCRDHAGPLAWPDCTVNVYSAALRMAGYYDQPLPTRRAA